VGSFPNWGRWAEWNGRFRDDLRRFVRGDRGMVAALATRLAGSSDLYQGDGRAPFHSINFVTSHDGLTLWDLVSHNRKHNRANGEDNRDGTDENFSWNCGVEGDTTNSGVLRLRRRQAKNLAVLLLLAQGVPMILSGDEFLRTQQGNNNAYCHDTELAWLNWEMRQENADMFRFFKGLIALRRRFAEFRRRSFSGENPDGRPWFTWHGVRREMPDWSQDSHVLGMHVLGDARGGDFYLLANAQDQAHTVELPSLPPGRRWHRLIDTSLDPPLELAELDAPVYLSDQERYHVEAWTVLVLTGKTAR
jgi:isoamylase